MAGYRRVNYYELCRLCTSSEGTKMHIFREEGRRRSLPSKIQTCLPLQVQEEDSLPKIICSTCVDKLESYFEFREACINAEAMLESYFTSLKYSDDLTKEGKVSVYVKDESKKKEESNSTTTATTTVPNTTKVKIPVSGIPNVTPTGDGNALIPSTIQIVTDSEGNRLTQYKVQVQGGIPSLIQYGEPSALPINISLPTLKQPTSVSNNLRPEEGSQNVTEGTTIPPPPPLVAAVTLTGSNQDLLQQMGIASKERNSVTEVVKFKNINILDTGNCEPVAISNTQMHANQITGQMTNVFPTQIRLDQTQLQQLIHSNLQINLSQLQPTQRENVIQNKTVNVMRSAVHISQNTVKEIDSTPKPEEEETRKTQKNAITTTINSVNERVTEKAHAIITSVGKAETDIKFQQNGVRIVTNIEENPEPQEPQEESQPNNDENQLYECESCTKTFKRKEHLAQHQKSHTGERPYTCDICPKAFSRKEHLHRHKVSHTGQKLFPCDMCHKNFSRKDNLHKHKKTHGINGPHVCETCGKSFVVKHYYIMHKAQHENLPNTENSSGVPVKHLISTSSTTNPLPFKCDLCNKSFSLKSYMTSHRARHRNKTKPELKDSSEQQPPQQQQQDTQTQTSEQSSSNETIPQQTIITSFPAPAGNLNLTTLNTQLTTINPNALLVPDIIHHSNANVLHIGNNSYLCTNVTSELLEQYRRIQSS